MKTKGKPWQFFVVALLILVFAFTSFFGVSSQYGDTVKTWIKGASDIRFGIDIRGGVEVTFMPAGGVEATREQMAAAESVIQQRLISLNITDSEVYRDDGKNRIILRFPWKEGETEFNPEKAIEEIGATALLTFREGMETDADGKPTGVTAENIILEGQDIKNAVAAVDRTQGSATYGEYYVSLELENSGKQKFAEATTRLAETRGTISIWMDDTMVSAPSVQNPITEGQAMITLNGSDEETFNKAMTLANQINSGSLPFALSAENYSTISPSLGANSLNAMVLAGIIAFILVAIYMMLSYRLHGVVSVIALLGQVAMTLAFVSGYFSVMNSFTLTLPGIAGVILAIGMGVDANVITGERIKEEMRSGKSIDGAIRAGFDRGLAPIIDGNMTVIIVAIILMGVFGPTDSVFGSLMTLLGFGAATSGTIYSFGYTLLVGVLMNFLFGVICTRVMLKGVSKLKPFRNAALYGAGAPKADQAQTQKPKKEINIVGNRKKYFIFSLVLFAVILVFSFVFGVQMDIQFKGGAMLTYSYSGDVDENALQTDVKGVLGTAVSTQTGSDIATGTKTFTITMPGTQTVDTTQVETLHETFTDKYADNAFEQLSINNVNPMMGKEFFAKCVVAIVMASVLILLYIAVRFKKIGGWPAGSMAVVALVHDMIIIFGVFVIARIPLNSNFIAAMLTILGYSINDTVVIYDRVRENRQLYGNTVGFEHTVNSSINQSLRRSINTTVSTVLALGTVCVVSGIYGLDSIFTFAFPLIIGMISGVYSTICIAGPLWVEWDHFKAKRGNKKLPGKKKA